VVTQTLELVESALLSVEPLTERVDARTAEFARRSRARIHYLSTVGSSRGRQVQRVFQLLSERYAGARLANIDEDIGLPSLQVGDPGMIGADSLRTPPSARSIGEIEAIADDVSEDDKERCLEQMASNIAFSLTVDRAHRFLERMHCSRGQKLSSTDMDIHNSDDIEDVVSLLLYSDTDDADYRIEASDEPGAARTIDSKGGYAIERFEVTRDE
jgi:hypothetical protein